MLRYLMEEEKKRLFSIAEKKDYQEGEIIFSEGDKNKEMYIIEKGKVKVFLEREGEEIELSTFSEGEFFGEMALFTGRERTASIKAIEPTTLLIFKRKDMERLIEEHPKIGAKVLFAV
ncbi:Crp/Fnr family transcriptional regulator, partial [bacterium]